MKDEDAKLLTEKLLGECWHHPSYKETIVFYGKERAYYDCYCGKADVTESHFVSRTFTTPDDMMAVKEKLVEKGEWEGFDRYAYGEFCRRADKFQIEITGYVSAAYSNWLINPERFCKLAVQFIKQKD
jgi:hypothetical protein